MVFTLVAGLAFPALANTEDILKEMLQKEKRSGGQSGRMLESDFEMSRQETAVDSNLYRVGAGDWFVIHVKELPSQEFEAGVSANGILFLKEFGEIPVNHMPLKDVYEAIRKRLRQSLRLHGPVFVSIRKIKKPVINVIGPLTGAGWMSMQGTARIFDAIKAANGGQLPASDYINLREVVVRNGDSARTFDLLQYMKHKDPDQNPYLFPGDEILLERTGLSILLAGNILWPHDRRIPIKPGETLGELIGSVLQLKSYADTSAFFLRREYGPMARIASSEAARFELKDNDWLIVSPKDIEWRNDTVSVTGEIMRPGVLPIQSGKTTAADVIAWAGGPTQDADLRRGFVVRRQKIPTRQIAGPAGMNSIGGMSALLPDGEGLSVRPEMSSAQKHLTASNDYAVVRLGQDPAQVLLEEGDELYLPRVEKYVYLSGQIRNPGAYLFQAGATVSDYIKMAGGFSSMAATDQVRLMVRYGSDAYQYKDKGELQSGDIIVVPTSIEFKAFKVIWLPVTQILISGLALILSILTLTR